jgi:MerC mercury resistance protein
MRASLRERDNRFVKSALEKLGTAGALVAAAACPVCFPKLALLGALFGLGAFGAYEAQIFLATQMLVIIAVIGHVLSYLRHRNAWLLGAALASGVAVFAGLYWARSEALIYAGFAGLVATSATEFWTRRRRRASPALESTITCPQCGARRTERMPTDACQFFYECPACKTTLRAKAGDCCVFCSYGTVKCPSMQAA